MEPDNSITVRWSRGSGMGALSCGSPVVVPAGILTPGQSVVMAEVAMDYTSPIGQFVQGTYVMDDTFFLRPASLDHALTVSLPEVALQALIKASRVLEAKEFSSWDWGAITELTGNPALYCKGEKEPLAQPRFLKRLLLFFATDSEYRLETRSPTRVPPTTLAGRQLLQQLTQSEEGCELVRGSEFFATLVAALRDLSPDAPVFGVAAVKDSVTQDYFVLLAAMCESPAGVMLLESTRVLDSLRACMKDGNGRRDLGALVLKHFDPRKSGAVRSLFEAAGRTGCAKLQLQLLRKLDELVVPSKAEEMMRLNTWMVNLLLDMAFGEKVHAQAFCHLHSIASLPELSRLLLPATGRLLQGREAAADLVLRALATEDGLRHVETQHPAFLAAQLSEWRGARAATYATNVDALLRQELFFGTQSHRASEVCTGEGGRAGKVLLPLHLFGVLGVHSAGAALLKEKGIVRHLESRLAGFLETPSSVTVPIAHRTFHRTHIDVHCLGKAHPRFVGFGCGPRFWGFLFRLER
jgi:hypothetical protein